VKPYFTLFLFGISTLFAILILKLNFSKVTDLTTFALGTKTVTYYAKDKYKNIIHISAIDSIGEKAFLNSWAKSGKKNVILFLGNSQTHSINQKKKGEVNYIELLDKNFNNHKVFANTFANASLQDFLISYNYWKSILPVKILVIPVFLDDMRELNGISYNFFPILISNKFNLVNIENNLIKKINLSFYNIYEKELKSKNPNQIEQISTQDIVEKRLNLLFDRNFDFWNNRKNAQGILFSKLYELRNTIFNIKATTIRPMMPSRYSDNISALDLIVKDAKKNKIKVFLYIPPIRNDFEKPYVPEEYTKLKNELQQIANNSEGAVYFKDFDNIVPGNYFGYKESTSLGRQTYEIDFMHFQYKGHLILSDSLSLYLQKNGIQ
jgi:hypothetical protein